jgi:hypothetical protein
MAGQVSNAIQNHRFNINVACFVYADAKLSVASSILNASANSNNFVCILKCKVAFSARTE